MGKVLDGVGDFSRIDTGAIVFQVDDMEDNSKFVEVRFIVKSEEFDVSDAYRSLQRQSCKGYQA